MTNAKLLYALVVAAVASSNSRLDSGRLCRTDGGRGGWEGEGREAVTQIDRRRRRKEDNMLFFLLLLSIIRHAHDWGHIRLLLLWAEEEEDVQYKMKEVGGGVHLPDDAQFPVTCLSLL